MRIGASTFTWLRIVYPNDITPETDNYPEPIGAKALKYVKPWKLPVAQMPGTPIKPDFTNMMARLACTAV
ncbi:MAG: hypothetical protein ACI4P4_17485 [Faecousia sp.]